MIRHQRGQALTEFVVAALFFIVPLFIAIVVLGKLGDVRHTTVMAARYAAWERTIWYDDAGTDFGTHNGSNRKTAAQINSEIAVRMINDRSAASVLRDTDRNATSFAKGTDPMWRDNAGVALLSNYQQQQGSSVNRIRPSTDVTATALNALSAIPSAGAPPVPTDTLATAEVSFRRIGANSQSMSRLWPSGVWTGQWQGLDFTATSGILSNTWAANGSGATAAMVKPSVPTAGALGATVSGILTTGTGLWDPNLRRPEFGKIAPDVVPRDRTR